MTLMAHTPLGCVTLKRCHVLVMLFQTYDTADAHKFAGEMLVAIIDEMDKIHPWSLEKEDASKNEKSSHEG